MNHSNFYILRHARLKPSTRDKRAVILENTIRQLRGYHKIARPLKRPVILRLIAKYESLVDQIKGA